MPISYDIRNETLIHKKWHFGVAGMDKYAPGLLITGANSFIGVHLACFLRKNYPGDIFLLLRAPSNHDAAIKMQNACDTWEIEGFDHTRFRFFTGDVTLNMMGLNPDDFQYLKKHTGRVIHLAMTPLYHLPYSHFKRLWLPELERMIEFCGDHRYPKSLHYASAFNTNFFQCDDDFGNLDNNAFHSGYSGFKWVAAKSVGNAIGQGLRGCVYDIPMVLGTEKAGLCPAHYSIWSIFEIFLKTGLFFPFSFRFIPADTLAEVFLANLLNEASGNGARFLRPMLRECVTSELFSRTVAGMLQLREAGLDEVREKFPVKARFDFLAPPGIHKLIEYDNSFPELFPEGFNTAKLPSVALVFLSNLNRIMTGSNEPEKHVIT